MSQNFYKIIPVAVLFVPSLAFAQFDSTFYFLERLKDILANQGIKILFSLALLLFFWGIFKFIRTEGGAKEDGRKIMLWGILALFVMSSVWGIVALFRQTLIGNRTFDNAKLPGIQR